MPSFFHSKRFLASFGIACSLCFAGASRAAMDPAFEIDSKVLQGFKAPSGPVPKAGKRVEHPAATGAKSPGNTRGVQHTVRAGDNLFRILMRDYGLSNAQAEASIKEILRENRINDIKRLKVGQIITLPVSQRGEGDTAAGDRRMRRNKRQLQAKHGVSGAPAQSLMLESPAMPSTQETALQLSEFWKKMVPNGDVQKPLSFQSPAFSLTLDPRRYPIYSAMKGARLVVDTNGTIPPLVKSLIMEKDPSVRFISGSPANGRKLLAAMLDAAGFYSVEENFVMEFGVDPQLKVHSDFKVEKTTESLIKQDVVLLNGGSVALPRPLVSFLEKQGFSPLEPFASQKPVVTRPSVGQVRQITARNSPDLVDAILTSLSVPYRSNFPVDVFSADNNGISLSVKADRYFERNGQRCVVSGFDGDPVTYTLFRILETKGYHSIILDGKDDFRKVSEKILAALHLPASYARQEMWPDSGSGYSLSMSGFRLEGADVPGGSLFLTNLNLDPIIRDLLKENGYDVQSK